MTMPRSQALQQSMTDWSRCPRCDWHPVDSGRCPRCRTDLSGQIAREIVAVSTNIARALAHRDMLIARLPVTGAEASAAQTLPPALPSTVDPSAPALDITGPGVSVQSVLAIAGAGLVAVAAVVFTFLNPDLTDFGTRTGVIAGVTLAFLGGASLLSRSALRFSAETVAGLAVVFVGLDVWALSETARSASGAWVLASIGTLAGATLLISLAAAIRMRVWLLCGLSALAIFPAFVGYSIGTPLASVIGHLGVGFASLAADALARRFRPRFGVPLTAESRTSAVLRVLVVLVVIGQLFVLDLGSPMARALGTSALLIGAAALAASSARRSNGWSAVAGALSVAGISVIPFASSPGPEVLIAAVPLAAAVAVGALALRPSRVNGIRPTALIGGGIAILLAASVPALTVASVQLLSSFSRPLSAAVSPELGAASIGAFLAVSGGIALVARRGSLSGEWSLPRSRLLPPWFAMAALVTVAGWSGLALPTQIATGLVGAVVTAFASKRMPHGWSTPLLIAAHTLLALVAGLAFVAEPIGLLSGGLVLVAAGLVARNVARPLRTIHATVGFGYALVVIAASLSPVISDSIALMCLVTAVAAVVALAVTLSSRFDTGIWYAVLGVTSVPFLIGVVSVLLVRSGWTALSTALIFALALTLVLTRRAGMTRLLRGTAAALLVPALAVVMVCLGAELLAVSGSPVVLPVIATIVAASLASVSRVAVALTRTGIQSIDARWVRRAIEGTALLTGALAIVLALVRSAAGLPTSILVLVILSVGGVLAARVAARPYGWPVAGASATGALWCALAWWGADVAELYLLPPALALLIVGAAIARRYGAATFVVGLGLSLLPSLVLLGMTGGSDVAAMSRIAGLLIAAAGLSVVGSVGARRGIHLPAARALAVGAIAASAAGALGGLRLAATTPLDEVGLVMLPVLALAVVATVLAAAGGRVLVATTSSDHERLSSRTPFMPATIYLVAGPIVAIRPGWLPILTLLTLSVMLLIAMVVTVARARARAVHAPPVWFLFGLAWITAVAGWTERELRVESFSLPLGAALLAVGVIASMKSRSGIRPTLASWPLGFAGSWKLLVPGLFVTLVPSMLATATDPLTWRAILVIAIALAAVLIGSLRRLAAPFILGIVVLPIENAIVFAVQIGRSISAAPWWITLATAGAALLVIAVTYERRGRQARGIGIRELG